MHLLHLPEVTVLTLITHESVTACILPLIKDLCEAFQKCTQSCCKLKTKLDINGSGKKERRATLAQKRKNLGMLQEGNHSHKYEHCALVRVVRVNRKRDN